MQTWILDRQDNSPMGMLGNLLAPNGEFFCRSIELPWRNNIPFKSCVPPGDYICRWTWSPAFKRMMYLVDNVPSRSGIRIHKGSYAGATDYGFRTDFLGCISFGTNYLLLAGQQILQNTTVTVAKFEDTLAGQDFILSIRGEYPAIPLLS